MSVDSMSSSPEIFRETGDQYMIFSHQCTDVCSDSVFYFLIHQLNPGSGADDHGDSSDSVSHSIPYEILSIP